MKFVHFFYKISLLDYQLFIAEPSPCPQTHCSLQCEFGLSLDDSGCPRCECRPSPCDQVEWGCSSPQEECRMVPLHCISEPCPPVPLCLPRVDNPCPWPGSPLTFEETGERLTCGVGSVGCPSSHKCNISPFGEYAVCCPKPSLLKIHQKFKPLS